MSPEERLAKITGRPVSSGPSLDNDAYSAPVMSPQSHVSTNTTPGGGGGAEDPPLETLSREDTPLAGLLTGAGAGNGGADMLSSLLGGGQAGQHTNTAGPAAGQLQLNDVIWVMLAIVVRLILDTEWSHYIANNCVLPFLLTLVSLYVLSFVRPQPSTASSLLSAGETKSYLNTLNLSFLVSALMLCGVKANIVGHLTKSLSFLQLFLRTFSLYLFTFFTTHVIITVLIDNVI